MKPYSYFLVAAQVLAFAAAATTARAVLTYSFPGWDELTRYSPNIFVAKCAVTPGYTHRENGMELRLPAGMFESELEMVFPIKTELQTNFLRVDSFFRPTGGEYYLVFGSRCNGGLCTAIEEYRFVPLGRSFSSTQLAGKTADEQVKLMLRWRLEVVISEISALTKERERLEKTKLPTGK